MAKEYDRDIDDLTKYIDRVTADGSPCEDAEAAKQDAERHGISEKGESITMI